MACKSLENNLKAYDDGELGLTTRMLLRAHLRKCRTCARELSEMQEVSKAMRSLGLAATPAALRDQILSTAAASAPSSPAKRGLPGQGLLRVRRAVRAAGLAAGVAAVAWLILIARQDRAAAVLGQIRGAASRVKTMHMVNWLAQGLGGRTRYVMWYADGRFRMETEGQTISIYDGKRLHTYDPRTRVFFKNVSDQPFGTAFGGFTIDAILAVKPGAKVSADENASLGGKRAMRLTIDDEGLGERVVVWADPDTRLPLEFKVYARQGQQWKYMGGSEKIEYNIRVDPTLLDFKPPANARVIDKENFAREWMARYEKGMGTVSLGGALVTLRDFQVCRHGDVYIIYSPKDVPGLRVQEATLTDDVGTQYAPGAGGFAPWPDEGIWFVPLQDPLRLPASYSLEFRWQREDGTTGKTTAAVREPYYSPENWPLYPCWRGLDEGRWDNFHYPCGAEWDTRRWGIVGGYWEKRGDLRAALRCYEKMLALAPSRIYYPLGAWVGIAELYEQVGDKGKAMRAYRRGLEVAEPWNAPDYVEKIRRRLAELERAQP
jgi:outer membrane lipoprotein-sorting protein